VTLVPGRNAKRGARNAINDAPTRVSVNALSVALELQLLAETAYEDHVTITAESTAEGSPRSDAFLIGLQGAPVWLHEAALADAAASTSDEVALSVTPKREECMSPFSETSTASSQTGHMVGTTRRGAVANARLSDPNASVPKTWQDSDPKEPAEA
jgi:hypothetical protein